VALVLLVTNRGTLKGIKWLKMLEVINISTGYGKKQVLYNVSFNVGDNEIVMLNGGNGSGKSTILKCIYGLLKVWNIDGQIFFNGCDLKSVQTTSLIKKGIVYIPQRKNYFESLTIRENILVSGSFYDKKLLNEKIQLVYQFPGLFKNRDRTPFYLSGGERQLLALGIALIHRPKLILFDEPFAGLDKDNKAFLLTELYKLKEQKIGMLIVEHNTNLRSFCNKELELYLGKVTKSDNYE